jgi:hypothetical protein
MELSSGATLTLADNGTLNDVPDGAFDRLNQGESDTISSGAASGNATITGEDPCNLGVPPGVRSTASPKPNPGADAALKPDPGSNAPQPSPAQPMRFPAGQHILRERQTPNGQHATTHNPPQLAHRMGRAGWADGGGESASGTAAAPRPGREPHQALNQTGNS